MLLAMQVRYGIAASDPVILWASPPCTAYSTMGRLRRRGGGRPANVQPGNPNGRPKQKRKVAAAAQTTSASAGPAATPHAPSAALKRKRSQHPDGSMPGTAAAADASAGKPVGKRKKTAAAFQTPASAGINKHQQAAAAQPSAAAEAGGPATGKAAEPAIPASRSTSPSSPASSDTEEFLENEGAGVPLCDHAAHMRHCKPGTTLLLAC